MSLRVNDVKKVLRDSGVEMDADDVRAVMRTRPAYQGLTRTQVAQSLSSLCESDPDIIRTRLGLYQHLSRHLTGADPTPAALTGADRRIPRRLVFSTAMPAPPEVSPVPRIDGAVASVVVVVEVPHLEDDLARHAGHRLTVSDPQGAVEYLASLARFDFGAATSTSPGALGRLLQPPRPPAGSGPAPTSS